MKMPRKNPLIYQPSKAPLGWTNLMFRGTYVGLVRDSHKVRQGERDEQLEVYAPTGELVGIFWVGETKVNER